MVTGKTKVIGIFGDPIEHSMSPVIHNAAFSYLGLDYIYAPFQVKSFELEKAVEGIRALNLVGVNVTIPHKEKVLPFLDELSEEARLIGAANVIVNEGGKLIGYNTDGQGFVESLRQEAKTEPLGQRVAVLGAGGAARAVAVQLALEGAKKIYLINRRIDKALEIVDVINKNTTTRAYAKTYEDLGEVIREVDIIINSTPIGMYPRHEEPSIIPKDILLPNHLVCDLIYNPLTTGLLQEALQKGCKTLKGTGMLIFQGALAFKKWTGYKAPIEVMYRALLEKLEEKSYD